MILDQHVRFCLRLHRRLASDLNTTVCWSPLSVSSALGLLTQGARGRTRQQLAQILLDDPAGDVTKYAMMLSEATAVSELFLQGPQRGQQPLVSAHNTLWTDSNIRLRTDHSYVTHWPGGAIRQAPFASNPDHAHSLINDEVSGQTMALIQNLVPKQAITADTLAVLTNAIFVRATWRTAFPTWHTAPAEFASPAGPVPAQMMRVRATLRHAHAHGWQLVDMPTIGGLSAAIVLPDSTLSEAEPLLTAEMLTDLLFRAADHLVELALPRLSLSTTTTLEAAVASAGASCLFTGEADLRGITHQALMVTAMPHQAILRVDEHGLEGAAATAAVVARSARRPDAAIDVVVDRPFLLLVRYRPSNAVYFMARVTEPTSPIRGHHPTR